MTRLLHAAGILGAIVAALLLIWGIANVFQLDGGNVATVLGIAGLTFWLIYLTNKLHDAADQVEQSADLLDRFYEHLWASTATEPEPNPDTQPIRVPTDTVPDNVALDDWLAREVEDHRQKLEADLADWRAAHPSPTPRGKK